MLEELAKALLLARCSIECLVAAAAKLLAAPGVGELRGSTDFMELLEKYRSQGGLQNEELDRG